MVTQKESGASIPKLLTQLTHSSLFHYAIFNSLLSKIFVPPFATNHKSWQGYNKTDQTQKESQQTTAIIS